VKKSRDEPDDVVGNAPNPAARRRAAGIRLFRDPRDNRELLTDTLGITVEASTEDAEEGVDARTSSANLLGRRKRQRAWEELQEPVNRLLEEALLYPVEPMPEPDDAEFPAYGPQLPQAPALHETGTAIEALLDAVAEALPPPEAVPGPVLRDGFEPPLPSLPDPPLPEE
jgi:hypothetical protein